MRLLKTGLYCAAVMVVTGCANTTPTATKLSAAPATTNQTALRIQAALPKYAQMSRQPWQYIEIKTPLRVGQKSEKVPAIRERLALLGDLPKEQVAQGNQFDKSLAAAVSEFQHRHGLKMTGQIDRKTLEFLNWSPAERYKKLQLNMSRWAKFPDGVGNHYIRVNTANFELDIIKDGEKTLNMRVVTGSKDNPTPELYSKLQTIVFNPTWNVPNSIIKNEIAPKMQSNPNYLTENNLTVYKNWAKDAFEINPSKVDWTMAQIEDFPYRLTQQSGPKNSLGRVKFVFMNEHDVYLHDTPQKGLFSQIQRAYSHGCIRLEKPMQLVEYFFKQDPSLAERSKQYLAEGKVKHVSVKNPLPIYITYITAWVDKSGKSHFREDIYQNDGV